MKSVVVYKTRPDGVARVLDLLRQQGLHPTQMDSPDSVLLHAAKGTYLVRISVPKDEAQQATTVLANWERSLAPDIERHTRSLRAHLAYSIMVTVSIGLAGHFMGMSVPDNVGWLVLLWLVSFVLFANGEAIGRAIRHSRK